MTRNDMLKYVNAKLGVAHEKVQGAIDYLDTLGAVAEDKPEMMEILRSEEKLEQAITELVRADDYFIQIMNEIMLEREGEEE